MVKPLDLPYSMKMLFKRIVTAPLGKDPGTDWLRRILGNTHEVNRRDVLQYGLADFKTEYRKDDTIISCSDKALLYCHYYMKYTFFACKRAFSDPRLAVIGDDEQPVFVADIGCGPGTAALALSDSFARVRLHYLGIDESDAMLDLAPRILRQGHEEGLVSPESAFMLEHRWQAVKHLLAPQNAQVLIIFSFCLGSPSLHADDIKELAYWIRSIAQMAIKRPIICFVNSPHSGAIEKFELLKKSLRSWTSLAPRDSTAVRYYNHQRSIGGQPIVYELGSAG
jgi:hypothetical protein